MVRPSYWSNFTGGTGDSSSPTADPFFALVFDSTAADSSGPVNYGRHDLLGRFPAPRRSIGWQTVFDLGDGQVKNDKKSGTTISSVLFTIPNITGKRSTRGQLPLLRRSCQPRDLPLRAKPLQLPLSGLEARN